MLKILKNRHVVVLALSACTTFASTGCRSGMPKMNMFGFKREPSPDTLAGAGPTTTYPLPPSTNASPQAIASIAGGTAPSKAPGTTQIASSLGQPTATPAATIPNTNYAAAQANGVYAPPGVSKPANAQPVGYNTPSYAQVAPNSAKPASAPAYAAATPNAVPPAASASPQPSGYVFGQKATAPAAAPSTTPSFSLPSSATTPSSTATASTPSASSSSGFAMPPGIAPAAPAVTTATAAISPPAAAAPAFSTASQTNASPSNTVPTSSVYTPGSTAGATSYPTSGSSAPSSGGSIYR